MGEIVCKWRVKMVSEQVATSSGSNRPGDETGTGGFLSNPSNLVTKY